jgi:fido (protein-threonine AMPylation protein)
MLSGIRIKRAHLAFLRSSRILRESKAYWSQRGPLLRSLLEWLATDLMFGSDQAGASILGALRWLEAEARNRRLSEEVIVEYHRILFRSKGEMAGTYRRQALGMKPGNPLKPTPAKQIRALMAAIGGELIRLQDLLETDVPTNREKVLHVAVQTYYRIGIIHPFRDGNGRVARLCMNHLLRRYGFGYVVFPSLGDSSEFWELLKSAATEGLEGLVDFAKKNTYSV